MPYLGSEMPLGAGQTFTVGVLHNYVKVQGKRRKQKLKA